MAAKLTDHAAALKHRYRIEPGGKPVPGVTTIINIIEKPGLMWAASEIGAKTALVNAGRVRSISKEHREWLASAKGRDKTSEKKRQLAATGTDEEVFLHFCRGEFQRQWNAKADRGTRVHDIAEAWANRETAEVSAEDEPYVDALEQFHVLYKPRFIHVESIVLNPDLGYGGRFDGIAELDGPDERDQGIFMLDYKTGGEWEDSNSLQFSGYLHGRFATYDAKGTLGPLVDLPRLDGARNVFLRPDGSCGVVDPFARINADDAWSAFQACNTLYKLKNLINAQIESNEGDVAE